MHDTDRVPRLLRAWPPVADTGPFVEIDPDDQTPTTTPSWSPRPSGRLARGTLLPPVQPPTVAAPAASRPTRRAVPTVDLAAIGLPIRIVPPPRRWGRVVATPLRPAPRRRARPIPSSRLVVLVLSGALAILLALWWHADAPRPARRAAAMPPPPPTVTVTPLRDLGISEEPSGVTITPLPAPAPDR
jgi:hypothetical protein